MSEQLRAATERLHKCKSLGCTGGIEHRDCPYSNGLGISFRDEDILVAAYLAEHPADDGEAVTREWRESVGLVHQWYPDSWGTAIHDPSPLGFAVQDDGRVMIRLGTTVSYLGDVVAKTRGHVRRLCQCLGIALNESSPPAVAKEEV